jgi:hypothetical protein
MVPTMVQMKELAEIEKDWIARGKPYCDHPRTDREYALSAHTGDTGCLDCGDSWPKGDPSVPRGVPPR